MTPPPVQMLKFAAVGSAAFGLGSTIIAGLDRVGVPPLLAQLPALAACVAFTWWCNRSWTFAAMARPSWHEFARYCIASAGGLAINSGCFSALVLHGTWPVAAFAIATLAAMLFNFAAYRYAVFRSR
jgi:putative flippase GtrA